MPVDGYDDDDDETRSNSGTATRFKEFDCPGCNAHNPVEFGEGDELLCNYCGQEYRVKVSQEGKAKLRET